MEGLGAEIISIREMGKGVLVAARKLPTAAPRSSSGVWYMEEDPETEE